MSEKRILEKPEVQAAVKPCQTLADISWVSKERPTANRKKELFTKSSAHLPYTGETKRAWESRWLGHKSGVRKHNHSAVKDHAEATDHDGKSTVVEILESGVIIPQKRLFLKAFHSIRTKDNVNEHLELPHVTDII